MSSVEKNNSNIIFFTILLVILLILFSPIFPALYHGWFYSNDNSHGILVPFISLYLIWLNRHAISLKEVRTSYLGLSILVFGLALYVLGYAGRIEFISRVAFVTAILGLVFYNFGRKIFFRLVFPLFFLFFMVPVPVAIENIVSFKLQIWVTQISSAVLSALSISVLREGNILHFANCSLEVAEACSGIRSSHGVYHAWLSFWLYDEGIILQKINDGPYRRPSCISHELNKSSRDRIACIPVRA